ncbi:MAG: hypothetical protein ACR2IE_04985 [Candidatus Sumerlaeaceae bacterium]
MLFTRIPLLRIVCMLVACMGCMYAFAESPLPDTRFVLSGARYNHYFDSTGSVTVILPPGLSASTDTLRLRRNEIMSGLTETTTSVYDPVATSTIIIDAALCGPGPSYLTVTLTEARQRAWATFSRTGSSPVLAQETSAAVALQYLALTLNRMDALFDPHTTGTWLGNDPNDDFHWSREDAYYAWALLQKGDAASAMRANAILQTLATYRSTTTATFDHGAFFTNSSDLQEPDQGATFFITSLLAELLLHPPALLTSDTIAMLSPAVLDAGYYLKRVLDTGYTLEHTNFAALAVAGMELAGKLHQDDDLTSAARYYLDGFCDKITSAGASFECNSPVYVGVSLWSILLFVKETDDTRAAAQCRVLIDRFWLELAMHHYAPAGHQAGPYSRAYDDGLRGGTGLSGLLLNALLNRPAYASTGRVSENFFAGHSLDINPAAFLSSFDQPPPLEIAQVFLSRQLPAQSYQRSRVQEFYSLLTPSYSLGTLDPCYTIQTEGFLLQVPEPGNPASFAGVYARCGATSDEVATSGERMRLNQHAVQAANRVIYFSDADVPPGEAAAKRAMLALVADERFGEWEDIRMDGVPVALPCTWNMGRVVSARRGGVYLAAQPIFANPTGPRDRSGSICRGDGHLNLSVFTADSSTPLNLAGERIEAGLIFRCEQASDWPSYAAFISDQIASSSVTVQEVGTSRIIEWTLGQKLSCTYDRVGRKLVASTLAGAALRPNPPAVSEFFMMLPPTGGSTALRDFQVDGLTGPGWIVYPVNSPTALLVNAGRTPQLVVTSWTSSAVSLPPFSSLRLYKPSPAAVHGWPLY